MDLAERSGAQSPLAGGIAAALDWWRLAGVDHDFADNPRDWLPPPAEPAVTEAAPPTQMAHQAASRPEPEPAVAFGGDPSSWPTVLAEFAPWWLTEPALDSGMIHGRIAPRGAAGAALLVLVDHPEAGDHDALLSGPQGRLLGAFLAAAGIAADQRYVASALPRHMPLPDWSQLNASGLGQLTRHHIALAAPQRVIVFGSHISPLLGHDPANSAQSLHEFNHEGRSFPVLVAPGLDELMARPRRKALLWQRWLEWTRQ